MGIPASTARSISRLIWGEVLEWAENTRTMVPDPSMPGTDWGEAIVEGIEGSGTMVLVFPAHSNTSPQIRREIDRAVDTGIPIIPFRIEDVLPCRSLQYFIGPQHWLDARTPPLEQHLHRLTGTIKALLSKRLEGFDAAGKEPPETPGLPQGCPSPFRRGKEPPWQPQPGQHRPKS